MEVKCGFSGFPEECTAFFTELRKNNNKKWFEEHRSDFETSVMEPARSFVTAMGMRLKEISKNIIADPRTNRSIFRIYRDTRFSRDKTPYKTHLGIFLWEGLGPKMECSGFYFHLEPPDLLLGGGIYMFPKHLLYEYRNSVVHPVYGPELVDALEKIKKEGSYWIGGKHYKKTPRGFDPAHPNAELLLNNGLHAGCTSAIPDELYSPALVEYSYGRFKDFRPLHDWLVKMAERARV